MESPHEVADGRALKSVPDRRAMRISAPLGSLMARSSSAKEAYTVRASIVGDTAVRPYSSAA